MEYSTRVLIVDLRLHENDVLEQATLTLQLHPSRRMQIERLQAVPCGVSNQDDICNLYSLKIGDKDGWQLTRLSTFFQTMSDLSSEDCRGLHRLLIIA